MLLRNAHNIVFLSASNKSKEREENKERKGSEYSTGFFTSRSKRDDVFSSDNRRKGMLEKLNGTHLSMNKTVLCLECISVIIVCENGSTQQKYIKTRSTKHQLIFRDQ